MTHEAKSPRLVGLRLDFFTDRSRLLLPFDAMMPSSVTRPAVGEEGEEVGDANVAVAIEVGGAVRLRRARTAQLASNESRLDAPTEPLSSRS